MCNRDSWDESRWEGGPGKLLTFYRLELLTLSELFIFIAFTIFFFFFGLSVLASPIFLPFSFEGNSYCKPASLLRTEVSAVRSSFYRNKETFAL